MKVVTAQSRSSVAQERLDATFFTSPGVAARERLTILQASGVKVERLGDLGQVWQPNRFSRAWASPDESGIAYLRPYDCLDSVPLSADRLSTGRTAKLDKLLVKPGMILQTCSGRNLGPAVFADEYLTQFALSHDMARIEIADHDLQYYVLVYLSTPTGRAVTRQGMSGSVIDHLSTDRIADVPVPMLDGLVKPTVERARHAVQSRASARAALAHALASAEEALPMPRRRSLAKDGWTVRAKATARAGRLDVAFNDPLLEQVRRQVQKVGGTTCGELAFAFLPTRYKRFYVQPPHGRPILSGRGLLQYEPINLQWVSDRSFERPEEYELREGMVLFGAVGRSEGRQGVPALVTADRDGWLASNDVMRLTPRPGVSPAGLWLSLASPQGQAQIKARSFGSVIDHMNPWDVETVVLPPIDSALAAQATLAWDQLAEATAELRQASNALEDALRSRAGEPAGRRPRSETVGH